MDPMSISLLFKDIIQVLSNPLIAANEVNDTICFMENQLISLYEQEIDIVNGIKYFKNMLDEINIYDNRYVNNLTSDAVGDSEKLQDIVLIADKYLCIRDDNTNILKSKYIIVECIMKTMMHLLWQRVYELYNESSMTLNTVYHASELFNNTVGDVIIKLKKCEIIKI